MMSPQTLANGIRGNGARAYQCAACGNLVTHSDRRLLVNGTDRHLFVNPAGVKCDFYTFISCPGAVAFGDRTEAHTWFAGYGWRMAFCRQCGQHIGWFYNALSRVRPREFWGILVSHLLSK